MKRAPISDNFRRNPSSFMRINTNISRKKKKNKNIYIDMI